MRHVRGALAKRALRVMHADAVDTIFGGSTDPDTTVPADGWALLRWVTRTETVDDMYRALDAQYVFVQCAANALDRMFHRDGVSRVDVHTALAAVDRWIDENANNPFGGEPYEASMQDELRSVHKAPAPKRKSSNVSMPRSLTGAELDAMNAARRK